MGLLDRLDALDRRFGLKRGERPSRDDPSWVKWLLLVVLVAVIAARLLLVVGDLSSGLTLVFLSVGVSVGALVLLGVVLFARRRSDE